MTDFLTCENDRRLAYVKTDGQGPTVVFLGGFKSDMGGTKAIYLEDWAKAQGRAYLRLDYSGHGESSEAFVDGCIGDWAADALAVISKATEGPLILVGSSMGGWISLIVAAAIQDRVVGLVGIAAAPDFTQDSMWNGFSDAQKLEMETTGQVALPSEYGEPYIITKRLIEDGREQLVLRKPMSLPFPVRFLQGTADLDVDMSVALNLLAHASGDDIQLRLVKGADHRFSSPECLTMVKDSITEVIEKIDL